MAKPENLPFQPVVGSDGQVDFEVGLTVLCLWADRSDETILKLVRAGTIQRYGKGRYRLRESLVALSRWQTDEQRQVTKSASDSRVRDARAREIELRIAKEQRDLIQTDEALGIVDDIIGIYRSRYGGLPARVTRDPVLRKKLEAEVDAIQHDVADALAKRAEALRSGGETEPSEPED